MKLIHRSELSKPKYNGISWPYWAKSAIAVGTVGAQDLYRTTSPTPADGNIEDGGKLSTIFPHIITGFGIDPHTSNSDDIALLIHGILATFTVSGTEILNNVVAKGMPLDTGVQGGVATTNTTTDLYGTGFRGVRFNLGDWIPIIRKGESVKASFNLPVALAALSVTTDVAFWTFTRRIGYIELQ